MKQTSVMLCLLIAGISCQPPLLAQVRHNKDLSSHCIFGQFKDDSGEVKPWLERCAKRIKDVRNKSNHQTFDGLPVACTFDVANSGEPANLKIVKSSGQTQVDEAAIDLIKTAAPYTPYSDRILVARGVYVEFSDYPNLTVTLPKPVFKKVNKSIEQPILSPWHSISKEIDETKSSDPSQTP